jgi:hypothetical protein
VHETNIGNVLGNIRALKAYCIAAHEKAAEMEAGHGSMGHSIILRLITEYGVLLENENIVVLYGEVVGALRSSYGRGLGEYLTSHIIHGIKAHGGLIQSKDPTQISSYGLHYKTLGFQASPRYLEKLFVSEADYQVALNQVKAASGDTDTEAAVLCLHQKGYTSFLARLQAFYEATQRSKKTLKQLQSEAKALGETWRKRGRGNGVCSSTAGIVDAVLGEEKSVPGCVKLTGDYNLGTVHITGRLVTFSSTLNGVRRRKSLDGVAVGCRGWVISGHQIKTFKFDPNAEKVLWDDSSETWTKKYPPPPPTCPIDCQIWYNGCRKCKCVQGNVKCDTNMPCGNLGGNLPGARCVKKIPPPTMAPTSTPTSSPTSTPTSSPTSAPTASPTSAPTASPTTEAHPGCKEHIGETTTMHGTVVTLQAWADELLMAGEGLPGVEVSFQDVHKPSVQHKVKTNQDGTYRLKLPRCHFFRVCYSLKGFINPCDGPNACRGTTLTRKGVEYLSGALSTPLPDEQTMISMTWKQDQNYLKDLDLHLLIPGRHETKQKSYEGTDLAKHKDMQDDARHIYWRQTGETNKYPFAWYQQDHGSAGGVPTKGGPEAIHIIKELPREYSIWVDCWSCDEYEDDYGQDHKRQLTKESLDKFLKESEVTVQVIRGNQVDMCTTITASTAKPITTRWDVGTLRCGGDGHLDRCKTEVTNRFNQAYPSVPQKGNSRGLISGKDDLTTFSAAQKREFKELEARDKAMVVEQSVERTEAEQEEMEDDIKVPEAGPDGRGETDVETELVDEGQQQVDQAQTKQEQDDLQWQKLKQFVYADEQAQW